MKSIFLPAAEEEFREAVRYYEDEAPGVGLTFITEIRRAVEWIIENPYAAVAADSGIRRKILGHFPYNILYTVESESIVIVAVAHFKRRPRYWSARFKQLKEHQGPNKGE
jgi:plasmid stabilization system protein ParE